jgi:hypothetical protein
LWRLDFAHSAWEMKGKMDERLQQWLVKSTLLNHIDNHFDALKSFTTFICPHPCCRGKDYNDSMGLRRHFFDAHSIEEPRSNCIKRESKWQEEPDLELHTDVSLASCLPADSQKHSEAEENDSLPISTETSIFDMEELVEEFTNFDDNEARCGENEGDIWKKTNTL